MYGPNCDDVRFFDILETFIANNDDKSFIIGGDFNVVLNPQIDKKNGRLDTNKRNRDKLISIITSYDLCDLWRLNNPTTQKYTWHSNNRPPIFCRLDYFLISSNISNRTDICNITTGIRSDHSLVYFNIDLSKSKRGPGYFKLNNSVILGGTHQRNIRESIREIAENNSIIE